MLDPAYNYRLRLNNLAFGVLGIWPWKRDREFCPLRRTVLIASLLQKTHNFQDHQHKDKLILNVFRSP